MNVLIVCAVGMSSSALTQKTREYLRTKEKNDIKVGSCGSSQADAYAMQADIIILAPQISYMKEELSNNGYTRVLIMPRSSYGEMLPEQVVEMIEHPEKYEQLDNAVHPGIQKIAETIGSNKVMRSITMGMQDVLPVSIIGSIVSLIRSFPVQPWISFLDGHPLGTVLDNAYAMTIGLCALYLCMQVSYHLAKERGAEGTGVGISALACFFIAAGVRNREYFDTTYLGTRGIFAALFTAVITAEVFAFVQKNTKQKETSRLPRNIDNSFRSILPSLVSITVTLIICTLVKTVLKTDLPVWIEKRVSVPLASIAGTSVISYLCIGMIAHLLWFFGMHGGQITNVVMNPILNSLSLANMEAAASGETLKYMIVTDAAHLYTFGGAGSTLALAILMAAFAKSRKLKGVGRLSVPMGIFFINEPVIFGIPVVLNPLLLIPFISIPAVCGVLTFTMMKFGLLPYPAGLLLPWTTPPVIWGFLQGGWRLGLWQAVMLVLQLAMWYPFFLLIDKQELDKEKSAEVSQK